MSIIERNSTVGKSMRRNVGPAPVRPRIVFDSAKVETPKTFAASVLKPTLEDAKVIHVFEQDRRVSICTRTPSGLGWKDQHGKGRCLNYVMADLLACGKAVIVEPAPVVEPTPTPAPADDVWTELDQWVWELGPDKDQDREPSAEDRLWWASRVENQHSYSVVGERGPGSSSKPWTPPRTFKAVSQKTTRNLPHKPAPSRPVRYEPLRPTQPHRGKAVAPTRVYGESQNYDVMDDNGSLNARRHPVAPRPAPKPSPTPAKPSLRPESFEEGLARIARDRRPMGASFEGQPFDDFYANLDRMDAAGVTW